MLGRNFFRQLALQPVRYAYAAQGQRMLGRGAGSQLWIFTDTRSRSSNRRQDTWNTQTVSMLLNKYSTTNISSVRKPDPVLDEHEVPDKLSGVEKLKLMWKRYGLLTVAFYFSMYGLTLSGMFFALETDLLSASSFGLDPAAVISKFCDTIESWTGNTTLPQCLRQNPVYGTAVLAYIMTKFTEPARLAITVLAIPKVAKVLRIRRQNQEDHH